MIADGRLEDVDWFALGSPDRLVFDFPGVESALPRDAIEVHSGPVQRVRIGRHAEKVRLVLDLLEPVVENTLESRPDGTRIRLVAQSAAGAAQAPGGPTEPTPEPTQEPPTLRRAPLAAAPATPEPPRRQVALRLTEAELEALANNLDLEIARSGPWIARERVEQAEGVFDPGLFAAYAFDNNQNPVASGLQGGSTVVADDSWEYSSGFNGILPYGMRYSSAFAQTRFDTDSLIFSLRPEWRANWANEITLPLLKNLFYNEANVNLKRARIGEKISDEDFRRFVMDLLVQVNLAYWDLAAARAEERVAQKSLQTAQELLEQTRVQYEVGVVSRVLVTQAEAGVADRELNAIQATNRVGNARDTLLDVIAVPSPAEFAEIELVPQDPAYVEYVVDRDGAIERAMRLRPELEAARQQVEDAELQLAYARNQRLPALDVTGSYTLSGLSGKAKDPDELLFPGAGVGDIGSSSDTTKKFFDADGAHSWGVRAELSIPLGNTAARHLVIQREIELRRSRTQLRRLEQSIILEVREASRLLRNAIQALQAAERRRVAVEETLRAEQERLRLGDSTPFQVLEFEEDLAEAENQEISSLQLYRNAITGLERSQGSLLETRGISLDEALGP